MLETLKYYPTPDGKAAVVELKGEKETLWTSRQHAKVMAEVRKHCAGCILETSPAGRLSKQTQ